MASEVEDCSTLEVDCLPSGSVSFGRYEAEPLSWERRSSFSHNRYLEEVEKYSTPGSVTKKKAYFEAHFKKTALRNQTSIGRQSDSDGQAESDMEDQVMKEFEDHGNGELRFEDFEKHENSGIQFSWYDETPDISDEEQHEVMETVNRKETLPSELPIRVVCDNDDSYEPVSTIDFLLVQHAQSKTPSQCDTIEPVTNSGGILVEQKSKNEVEHVNAEKMDASAKSSADKKVHSSSLKKTSKPSPTAKATTEQRTGKEKSTTEGPAGQIRKKISTEKIILPPGMSSAKAPNKMEKEIPVRSKQYSSRISPSTCSGPQNMKSQDSDKVKAKTKAEIRSSLNTDKGDKTKRVLFPSSISHQQGQVDGRSKSTNRDKRVINTTKSVTRVSGVIFSFKSDERAEKRKEFYMKLEEKQHTKEVEMNEIQARKQEETEAELKQLRKSLNFKATPMPSFYHGAGPKVLDGKKAINGPLKSPKFHSKHTTPASRGITQASSPLLVKDSNPQGPSTIGEHSTITQHECLATSEGENGCATGTNEVDTADLKQSSEPGKKVEALKKEDRAKANLQQQQGVSKTKKGDRVGKVRSGTMRKVIKGMATSGVAVHVAS